MPTTTAPQTTDQQPVNRRVLGLWQPFASLLASGIKTVDSRGFNTNYRGEFYIHASQNIPRREVYDDYYLGNLLFRRIVNRFLQVEENATLSPRDFRQGFITGKLIGKATLTDSRPSNELKIDFGKRWKGAEAWQVEEALGDHGPGRYGWTVKSPELIVPTPVKGKQAIFWSLPDHFLFFK